MKKKITVEGMSCAHCVRHVEGALKEIKGVLDVNVDLKGKAAVVETNGDIAEAELKSAVEEAGYDVVSIIDL